MSMKTIHFHVDKLHTKVKFSTTFQSWFISTILMAKKTIYSKS